VPVKCSREHAGLWIPELDLPIHTSRSYLAIWKFNPWQTEYIYNDILKISIFLQKKNDNLTEK